MANYLHKQKMKERDKTMEAKIRNLIKEAMIEKNKNKQITYKNILESAQKTAKELSGKKSKELGEAVVVPVDEEMLIRAAKNEIKQLKDVIQYCESDADRMAEINEKIEYCKAVLPYMASKEEIMEYLVENEIEKNIGVCMKALKEKFGANMDGKEASMVAKEYVSK